MTLDRLGPLPGARCLVVGGCGGIGRAYVDGLLAHRARVAVIDLPISLKEAPLPDDVMAFAADATDEVAATGAVLQAGDALSGFDVFAYVAGINGKLGPMATMRSEDFRSVLRSISMRALQRRKQRCHFCRSRNRPRWCLSHRACMPMRSRALEHAPLPKGGLASLMKVFAREGAPKIRRQCGRTGNCRHAAPIRRDWTRRYTRHKRRPFCKDGSER